MAASGSQAKRLAFLSLSLSLTHTLSHTLSRCKRVGDAPGVVLCFVCFNERGQGSPSRSLMRSSGSLRQR